ncbi:hypothetical protein HK104_009246 [Borealophlyctis nickersoniae]|nr:hypothetical protein HK104_009246 [Borealophlyctis nickersoniae]
MEYNTHARQFVALTARAIEELGNVTIPAVGVKDVFCGRDSLGSYYCDDGQSCYQKGSTWYCRKAPSIPVIVGSVVGAVVVCIFISVCTYYARKRKAQAGTVVAQPTQLQAGVMPPVVQQTAPAPAYTAGQQTPPAEAYGGYGPVDYTQPQPAVYGQQPQYGQQYGAPQQQFGQPQQQYAPPPTMPVEYGQPPVSQPYTTTGYAPPASSAPVKY